MQLVEVEEVEAADGDAVHEERPGRRAVGGRLEKTRDRLRGVVPVHGHPPEEYSLYVLGSGDDDGGERRVPLASPKGPVIDGDHPDVALREGAPQR